MSPPYTNFLGGLVFGGADHEHVKCCYHAFWIFLPGKNRKEGGVRPQEPYVLTLAETNGPIKLVTNTIDTPCHLNQIFTHAQVAVRATELPQHTQFVDHRGAYV